MLEERSGRLASAQQRFFSNPAEPAEPSDWEIPLAIVTPSGTEQVLYTNASAAAFDALLTQRAASERWVKVNQNSLCLLQQRRDAVQISNHYEAIAVETFLRNVQPNRLCRSVQLHDGRSLDLRVFYDFKRTSESRLLCTWIEYCSASNGFGVFDRIDVAF